MPNTPPANPTTPSGWKKWSPSRFSLPLATTSGWGSDFTDRGSGTLTLINDRPDVAVLAGADGVHLGQEDLDLREVRRLVGPRLIVGASTHSLPQAQQAVRDGADYIGVGPTFPSATKEFARFPGLELLRQVHREVRLPAFAIGGITLDNVEEVLEAGADAIAVCAAVTKAADPAQACGALKEKIIAFKKN